MWTPYQGPQTQAIESEADETLYGGSAGGGKSDWLLGTAVTQHQRSIIFRREYPQLRSLVERSKDIIGDRGSFNHSEMLWRLADGRLLEFGAVSHPDDVAKYQGRPHDFIGFDEGTHFTERMFLFLIGWLRTTIPGQRTRIGLATNPPTSAEGEWIIKRWRAWLDPQHSNPAEPGELRWYAMIDGVEQERENSAPFAHGVEVITPRSRTFIPARVGDNPALAHSGYVATLQALPSPLREQLLYGDFTIGLQSDPWQVIPTDWIVKAQDRWTPGGRGTTTRGMPNPLDCVGADLAYGQGGRTVLAKRYGPWIAPLEETPGNLTPTGREAAAMILQALTEGGFCNLDVANTGADAYRLLYGSVAQRAWPISYAGKTDSRDMSNTLGFANIRAAMYWNLREMLDPNGLNPIALPPDRELRAELAAPIYQLKSNGVLLEEKAFVAKRLGRSPDKADAVVMACWNDPMRMMQSTAGQSYGMKVGV